MNKFLVNKEIINNEEDKYTYGIVCKYPDEEIVINDVTTEPGKAQHIVDVFNREQPEKVHIYDILENYLLDYVSF